MLPAAVSPLVSGVVAGRPHRGTVLGVHRYGLFAEVSGVVLPVLPRDAVALPTAVRLAVCSRDLDWGVRAGDPVRVGAGRIVLPGLELVAARHWTPARVAVSARGVRRPSVLDEALQTLRAPAAPGWLLDQVVGALGADDPQTAVGALVGRGPGLTPSGDDALAGALLQLRALGDPRAAVLAVAVRSRLRATTAVSAALLDAAADGWAAPEAVALVDAVSAGDGAGTLAALGPVLRIGHSSGRDLVAGVTAALATPAPTGRIAA